MTNQSPFFCWDELDWIVMDETMCRKQIWRGQIMNLRMELKPGTHPPAHAHPHEQTGNVIQGTLKMRIGDAEKILTLGHGYIIPPNVPHALEVVGDETVIMLETFTPPRADLMQTGEKQ
jgi:quercetin dioxygenase-like cupin family protein